MFGMTTTWLPSAPCRFPSDQLKISPSFSHRYIHTWMMKFKLKILKFGFLTWNSTLLGITKRPSLYKSVRHKLFCCFTEINFYNYTTKCHACIFAESIKLSAAASEIFISILLQLFLKSAGISW